MSSANLIWASGASLAVTMIYKMPLETHLEGLLSSEDIWISATTWIYGTRYSNYQCFTTDGIDLRVMLRDMHNQLSVHVAPFIIGTLALSMHTLASL